MANVLIVDDSKELLELLSLTISKNNTVRTAIDAGAAEAQLNKLKPDIAFVDINLCTQDGRQLCHLLATEHQVPVILISGDPVKLENFSRFGAVAVLEKPFRSDEVEAMINAVL
ncbi:response regulator transcription factor [Ferruginibacter sp. HRS2-29]|uniref:response regulator transcription factor n=1 Tax=Ferruginibacter sp. HRS2-29 TaxID=2487334 RepID=UPI0020CC2242|nr:response regulator [Ferruginibacter sp. HRS2-29]MCP9750551.1 response regulator [Ferruginibacter sp. HRS2-29]